ncbi:hypothetical protein [Bradyrhizobium sp. STM 3809]|uniref:hypothetical protein n=1 Tax=Bradyrhizobium sp. STM 3809 TaxID=551936 RepID=UPI0011125EC5|nr:hypothetical protein [Bradyrhizobium sp. STM 3809]
MQPLPHRGPPNERKTCARARAPSRGRTEHSQLISLAVFAEEQPRKAIHGPAVQGISTPLTGKIESETRQLQALTDHFLECAKFEQSLPKRMTNAKRSSTNSGLRLTLAEVWWSKSREEPWRAKSSVNPLNKIKSELAGYQRVDTISEQGPLPCSIFLGCIFLFQYIRRSAMNAA